MTYPDARPCMHVDPNAPRYRTLARAALLTAGVSLLAFGLAHMSFITWTVDRSEDPSLLLRLGLMLGAPMMVGAIPSLLAAAIGAYAWKATWGTPLASWRWGPVLATALLPAILVNLAVGPSGDTPAPWAMPVILGGVVLVPATIGAWVARSPWGFATGAAALPVGATLSMFIQAEPLSGWVLPFVIAMLLIFSSSGWLMARLLARSEPFSPGPPVG